MRICALHIIFIRCQLCVLKHDLDPGFYVKVAPVTSEGRKDDDKAEIGLFGRCNVLP